MVFAYWLTRTAEGKACDMRHCSPCCKSKGWFLSGSLLCLGPSEVCSEGRGRHFPHSIGRNRFSLLSRKQVSVWVKCQTGHRNLRGRDLRHGKGPKKHQDGDAFCIWRRPMRKLHFCLSFCASWLQILIAII